MVERDGEEAAGIFVGAQFIEPLAAYIE